MNRRQISALLILKELGIGYKMESFADRLSVQKSLYLAQAAGVDLGHYYNWYLRGPYSPTVTQDIFDAIENYDVATQIKEWELDQKTREGLSKLSTSFQPKEETAQPDWLELLASVHFLVKRQQVSTANPLALKSKLESYSKFFSEKQVSAALQQLQAAELLPATHA
ncbi:MAG: hypothetical protein H6729_09770 [Deltaproteobacteria bacterium]|nr:hypothetical protein [Deltaproteobacteria bacterium]